MMEHAEGVVLHTLPGIRSHDVDLGAAGERHRNRRCRRDRNAGEVPGHENAAQHVNRRPECESAQTRPGSAE